MFLSPHGIMLRKSDIKEKQSDRIIFLKKAYELSGGNPTVHISLKDMKREIDAWSIDLFEEYAAYWIDNKHAHGVGKAKKVKLIRLTAYGIDLAEKELLADQSIKG